MQLSSEIPLKRVNWANYMWIIRLVVQVLPPNWRHYLSHESGWLQEAMNWWRLPPWIDPGRLKEDGEEVEMAIAAVDWHLSASQTIWTNMRWAHPCKRCIDRLRLFKEQHSVLRPIKSNSFRIPLHGTPDTWVALRTASEELEDKSFFLIQIDGRPLVSHGIRKSKDDTKCFSPSSAATLSFLSQMNH